jgi:chromosome partitioning protein
MPVIALVGNKGGAGKTTLCVNLAAALRSRGSVVVLDADPQLSSLQWRAIADSAGSLDVVSAVDDLTGAVRSRRDDVDHVVVDCPPSVHARQTGEALALADIALIPVQPSPLDIWATVHIERAIEQVATHNPGLRPFLVINQLEPRTRLSRLVRTGLAELGLPAANTAIRRRVAYRTSVLEGRTVHDLGRQGAEASAEIHQLIDEVIDS